MCNKRFRISPINKQKQSQVALEDHLIKVPFVDFWINSKIFSQDQDQDSSNEKSILQTLNYQKIIEYTDLETSYINFYLRNSKLISKKEPKNHLKLKTFIKNFPRSYFALVFNQQNQNYELMNFLISRRLLMQAEWIPKDYVVECMSHGIHDFLTSQNYGQNMSILVNLVTRVFHSNETSSQVDLQDMQLTTKNGTHKQANVTLKYEKTPSGFILLFEVNPKWTSQLEKKPRKVQCETEIQDLNNDNDTLESQRRCYFRERTPNETNKIQVISGFKKLKLEKYNQKLKKIRME